MCNLCGKYRTFSTRRSFGEHVRRQLIKKGITAVKATYDTAGYCIACGECGRCPGWHPPEDRIGDLPSDLKEKKPKKSLL